MPVSRKSVFLMTIFKGQRQIQIFGMMKKISYFKLVKNANDKVCRKFRFVFMVEKTLIYTVYKSYLKMANLRFL